MKSLRVFLKYVRNGSNILNSIVISVLFFNFENKFSIFSRNIQFREKPNTSPEAEDQSYSKSFNRFCFATSVKSNLFFTGPEGLTRVAFEFPFQNSFQNSFKIRNIHLHIHSDYVILGGQNSRFNK